MAPSALRVPHGYEAILGRLRHAPATVNGIDEVLGLTRRAQSVVALPHDGLVREAVNVNRQATRATHPSDRDSELDRDSERLLEFGVRQPDRIPLHAARLSRAYCSSVGPRRRRE